MECSLLCVLPNKYRTSRCVAAGKERTEVDGRLRVWAPTQSHQGLKASVRVDPSVSKNQEEDKASGCVDPSVSKKQEGYQVMSPIFLPYMYPSLSSNSVFQGFLSMPLIRMLIPRTDEALHCATRFANASKRDGRHAECNLLV